MKVDLAYTGNIDPNSMIEEAREARQTLETGSGKGSDMRGWLDLPHRTTEKDLQAVEEAAREIRQNDALVVLGIGGSNLGAQAVIDALVSPFANDSPIFFAGNHLDPDYHAALLDHLSETRYCVNVISKSGNTMEPAIALRLFRQDLIDRFGREEAAKLIFVTTGSRTGSLNDLARVEGLTTFVVPEDVGGRFSVLTPVGLLPIAVAGLDVGALVDGAREISAILRADDNDTVDSNPALAYAAYRLACYRAGKKNEVLVSFTPQLRSLCEWWRQLFGESEGKDGKGIIPAASTYTTDLHSMGQWMQEGERTVLGTFIDIETSGDLIIPTSSSDMDGLGYLAGRPLREVNRTAVEGAIRTHRDGGVPCARIEIPSLNAKNIGALLYMFEYACGISAYAMGVNPFDQPGVEAFKKNIRELL